MISPPSSSSSDGVEVNDRYIRLVNSALARAEEDDADGEDLPTECSDAVEDDVMKRLSCREGVELRACPIDVNNGKETANNEGSLLSSKVAKDPLLQRCFGFSDVSVKEKTQNFNDALAFASALALSDDMALLKSEDSMQMSRMAGVWRSARPWYLAFSGDGRQELVPPGRTSKIKDSATDTLSRLPMSLLEHVLSFVDPRTIVCHGKLHMVGGRLGAITRVFPTDNDAIARRGRLLPSNNRFYPLAIAPDPKSNTNTKRANPYTTMWAPSSPPRPTSSTAALGSDIPMPPDSSNSKQQVECSSVRLREALTQLATLDFGSERYNRENGGRMMSTEEALRNKTKGEWTSSDEEEDGAIANASKPTLVVGSGPSNFVSRFWVNLYRAHLERQVAGLSNELESGESHFIAVCPVGLEGTAPQRLAQVESGTWNHFHSLNDISMIRPNRSTASSFSMTPFAYALAGLECDNVALDDEECRAYLLHSNISQQCRSGPGHRLPMGPLLVPPSSRMGSLESAGDGGRRKLTVADVRNELLGCWDSNSDEDDSEGLVSPLSSSSQIRFALMPLVPQSVGAPPHEQLPPPWVFTKLLANVTLRTTFFPAHYSSARPIHDHPKDLLFLFEAVQCQFAVGLRFAFLGKEAVLQPHDEETLRRLVVASYDPRQPFPLLARTASRPTPHFYSPRPLTQAELQATNNGTELPQADALTDPSNCPPPQDPSLLSSVLPYVLFPVWVSANALDAFTQGRPTPGHSTKAKYHLDSLLAPELYSSSADGGVGSATRKFSFSAGSSRERMLRNRLIVLSEAAESEEDTVKLPEEPTAVGDSAESPSTNHYTSSVFMLQEDPAHVATRVYPLFPIPILRLYHYLLRSLTVLDMQQHSWLNNERRMAVFTRVTSPIGPSSIEFRFFITVLGSGYQRLHTKMVFIGSKYSETKSGCRIRGEYERDSQGLPETTLFVGGYGRVEVDIRPRVRADAYREAAAALHLPVGFPLELLHNVVMVATGSCPWLAQETLGLLGSYNNYGWTNAFDEAFEKEAAAEAEKGGPLYYHDLPN